MDYRENRNDKLNELFRIKKEMGKKRKSNNLKFTDTLMISNDRVNTLVLSFGILICTIFISIIVR